MTSGGKEASEEEPMIKFRTVEGRDINVNPKLCASVSRKKKDLVLNPIGEPPGRAVRAMDTVTLHMAGGQNWRITARDFNRHAAFFEADEFPRGGKDE